MKTTVTDKTKTQMPRKTKEPATKTFDVTLNFKPQEGFGGGFRTEWLSGETDDVKFGVDSGAGLGNAFLTFWVENKKTGKREYFNCRIETVVEQALEKLGVR